MSDLEIQIYTLLLALRLLYLLNCLPSVLVFLFSLRVLGMEAQDLCMLGYTSELQSHPGPSLRFFFCRRQGDSPGESVFLITLVLSF